MASSGPPGLPAGQLAIVAVRNLFERAGADQVLDLAAARVEAREERQGLPHGQEFLRRRFLQGWVPASARKRAPSGSPR